MGFLFTISNAQIDFSRFKLHEEISTPLLKKVFPSVKFNFSIRNENDLVIIGEIENKKFLFEPYWIFQFNKLYDEVKEKNNCTIKEKLLALITLFSYIQEHYKYTDIGLIKYEECKFNIDTIYEKPQYLHNELFHWYAKCTSQNGFFEMYFNIIQHDINYFYIEYNGSSNGITCPLSYIKKNEGYVFTSSNVVPEISDGISEYYIVTNDDLSSTNNSISFSISGFENNQSNIILKIKPIYGYDGVPFWQSEVLSANSSGVIPDQFWQPPLPHDCIVWFAKSSN